MTKAEARAQLVQSFRWVGDRGTRSTAADRDGWLRSPELLRAIGPTLYELASETEPTVVLGPQSSGYPLGVLVALSAGLGFVGATKERHSFSDSDKWVSAFTPLDYRGRNMELSIRARLLTKSDRVLIVDDWADTGGQLLGLHDLVERTGARVAATVVVVDALSDNVTRRRLDLRSILNVRDL